MLPSDIATLLNTQETKAKQLLDILTHELEILKTRELSILEEKSKEKELCLQEINQLDSAIQQHATIEELKANDTYAAQIEQILDIFQQCKKQNEVNGQIINNSQIAINRFKGMLQKSIANNSLTYDEKGNTNIKTRSIGIKA